MQNAVDKVKNQVSKTQITTVNDFMREKKDLIRAALPKHITEDRLIAIFQMCLNTNSELHACSQKSLISAIVQTAQLGLIPGNINHCYYVPFNNKDKKTGKFQKEVQFILGYRGMIELVNRSGKAVILTAECVYKNDTFDCEQGLNPILRHIPTSGDRGALIGCYCVAKNLIANEKLFVYLKKEDIDKVRKASKAGQSDFSPWAKWYEAMAMKTAVKRICKLLPLSMDIQKQVATDETIKSDIAPDMTEVKDNTNWEEAEIVENGAEKPSEAKGISEDENAFETQGNGNSGDSKAPDRSEGVEKTAWEEEDEERLQKGDPRFKK